MYLKTCKLLRLGTQNLYIFKNNYMLFTTTFSFYQLDVQWHVAVNQKMSAKLN